MKTGIVFVGVRTLALMHDDVKIMKQYNLFKVYIPSFYYTVMTFLSLNLTALLTYYRSSLSTAM
jgi:hypothetical protein